MIIGVDGNEANLKQRVGVNTYAFELLKNFQKLQAIGEMKDKLIVYLKNEPLADMPKESELLKYKVIRGGKVWIITKLMPTLLMNSDKCNVFLSPSHYAPPITPMPHICSIMDLGYLNFSEQFRKKDFWQLKVWSAISMYTSKSILTISNSTKEDIVRHYPSLGKKVHVTHLAYDAEQFNTSIKDDDVRRVRSRHSIVKDYVLYLGTLKPSKNIEGLIEAFKSIENCQLVIAGKKGWMYESIFEKVKELGLTDKVIFTDFISEEEKPALIKGARVFVLPSFWEGFGLDVLNAMASGVPVVVSNIGSLPEVAGDAGVLVDPKSIESIANGINEVLKAPPAKYNNYVKLGLAQAKKFSWEKTARETLKIITNS